MYIKTIFFPRDASHMDKFWWLGKRERWASSVFLSKNLGDPHVLQSVDGGHLCYDFGKAGRKYLILEDKTAGTGFVSFKVKMHLSNVVVLCKLWKRNIFLFNAGFLKFSTTAILKHLIRIVAWLDLATTHKIHILTGFKNIHLMSESLYCLDWKHLPFTYLSDFSLWPEPK